MSLHQKITEARKNKGFTQEELASRANVTARTIQRIESGDTVPRNFTLRAIAQALDIPFEELLPKNGSLAEEQKPDAENDIHFLKLVNLSSFTYLFIPFVHFLIPMYLLKKRAKDGKLLTFGRRIMWTQIYWLISVHLVIFFFALAYNLGISHFESKYYVNYLWPLFIMYFVNAVIILVTHFRIKTNYSSSDAL